MVYLKADKGKVYIDTHTFGDETFQEICDDFADIVDAMVSAIAQKGTYVQLKQFDKFLYGKSGYAPETEGQKGE